MLTLTPQGLYCAAGNFYIDPSRAVENAVTTHAHSDHARRGSQRYYCASSGVSLLQCRIGEKHTIHGIPFRESFRLGPVKLSFHPAGHILGSAQVRMELDGEVWVASGDYKRDADPTCEPFESVPCDVFVTEATFGTPSFRWKKNVDLGREIYSWWEENAREGANSVLFAYSLGKAQRVLGVLQPFAKQSVYCDAATIKLSDCYRAQGIQLAPTLCMSTVSDTARLEKALVLAPQSFMSSSRVSLLGSHYKTAFASGWTARGHQGFDHGFVMSDHADWDDLVRTVTETKARRVYVQHRGHGALVRHLQAKGILAYPVSELTATEPEQAAFSWA